ncbi:MAG: hypothetical protein AB7O96_04015 [Pseudobdellovibrionaceae bacterium]
MSQDQIQKIPVQIIVAMDADRKSSAVVEVRVNSKVTRMKEAGKGLALCWVLALLFVFVPVFHFVLVPAAIIAGVFVFWNKMELQNFFVSGEFRCPKCNAQISPKQGSFNWPKREECCGCREKILIQP